MINTKDKEISNELKNGEPFIWTEKCQGELHDFLEFAVNGVGLKYGYDHLICGYKDGIKEPCHVVTCRGKEFALKCVMMFNNVGMTCAVYPKKDNGLWIFSL
jgi:hypothetical protein